MNRLPEQRPVINLNHLFMKNILIFISCLSFFSCNTIKKTTQDSGRVIVQIEKGISDSAIIKGTVFEMTTKENIQVSDIWIGDIRYPCDTNGNFRIDLQPGKYNLLARGFSYKSYHYNLKIKKGEIINLLFYLVPVKFNDNK